MTAILFESFFSESWLRQRVESNKCSRSLSCTRRGTFWFLLKRLRTFPNIACPIPPRTWICQVSSWSLLLSLSLVVCKWENPLWSAMNFFLPLKLRYLSMVFNTNIFSTLLDSFMSKRKQSEINCGVIWQKQMIVPIFWLRRSTIIMLNWKKLPRKNLRKFFFMQFNSLTNLMMRWCNEVISHNLRNWCIISYTGTIFL